MIGSKKWMGEEDWGKIQRCCPVIGVLPKVTFLLQGTFSFSRPNPQSGCDRTELCFFLKEQTRIHVRLSLLRYT